MKRIHLAVAATTAASAVLVASPQLSVAAAPASAVARPTSAGSTTASGRLTNLAHLDFLGDSVTPPAQAGHTTYRLAEHPAVGVLWTYADHRDGGTFARVGGGDVRPGDRHLRPGRVQRRRHGPGRRRLPARTGSRPAHASSRRAAPTRLLRGLTYLQTATGPNAGNVVLWMQPDGTLNPSADPKDDPRPVRQRRVLLAGPHHLGARRGLRRVPSRRPALRRLPQAAHRPGRRRPRPGGARPRTAATSDSTARRYPAWLIADGADASRRGRARARGLRPGRRHLRRAHTRWRELADGIAAAVRRRRPAVAVRRRAAVGAVPLGLARLGRADAGRAGRRRRRARRPARWPHGGSRLVHVRPVAADLRRPGQRPAADPRSTPARSPTAPTRGCRGCSPSATAAERRATELAGDRGRPGSSAPTPPAPRPTTRPPASPSTGSAADGTVNQNSGAESTIHGLLTMLALDAHPEWPRSPRASDRAARGSARRIVAGRGRHADRRRERRHPRVGVDRRVAVRRHRLRRPSATAARRPVHPRPPHPASLLHAGRRPAARQHRPSPPSRPAAHRLGTSGPATSARRATRPHRARCCR